MAPRLGVADLHAAILSTITRWGELAEDAASDGDLETMRADVLHLAKNIKNGSVTLGRLMERLGEPGD